MSSFFTDPKNSPRTARTHNLTKAGNGYVDFKEDVCETLQRFGIPLRPAELAVIDFRSEVIEYFKKRFSAAEAATLLADRVREVYKAPPL